MGSSRKEAKGFQIAIACEESKWNSSFTQISGTAAEQDCFVGVHPILCTCIGLHTGFNALQPPS